MLSRIDQSWSTARLSFALLWSSHLHTTIGCWTDERPSLSSVCTFLFSSPTPEFLLTSTFFFTLPFVSACKFPGPMKFVCMEPLNFAACSQGAGLFGGSQEDAPCLGLDMIHAYRTMTAIYTHTYCFSSSTETWTLTHRTYH